MNNINTYCQLKYACNLGISINNCLPESREKCVLDSYNQEFYVEKYYDFEALRDRIENIYHEIVQGYEAQGIVKYSNKCSFPELLIFNKYGEHLPVGISAYGWKISIYFFYYLNKYFETKYGVKDSRKKILQLTESQEVFFYLDYDSEPHIVPARELVSEETAHIILKEFLNTGRTEQEIKPDIFYQEISKRNYQT